MLNLFKLNWERHLIERSQKGKYQDNEKTENVLCMGGYNFVTQL